MKLEGAGFARVRDYVAQRFTVEALQRFIDDPAKHQGSVRDALDILLNETAADAFTLADYARQFGARDCTAEAVLDGPALEPGAYLIRMEFASDAGLAILNDVCTLERAWSGGRDLIEHAGRNMVRLSPLLTTAAVLMRAGTPVSPGALAHLAADRFCLDAENLIDRPHPLAQRVGALVLRLAA